MKALTSQVFNNGNSQAVRIPQAFKLDAQQVEISRAENGDLVIHPVKLKRGDLLLEALSKFDDEFAIALELNLLEQQSLQERALLLKKHCI